MLESMWPGWETLGLIGRGSFGAVYMIQRDLFGDVEKAALKVISIPQNAGDIDEMYSDGYDDESITNAFQSHLKSIVAEYSLMRKMNGSANIVSCDDIRYIQHDDGIGWDIYIKMELLTPLTKALPAVFSEETAIKVAKDMCAALELCKKYDIIHRDIKPHNIFLSPNGDYKLGDFGIAKTVEKTMGGTKVGTYKYMAPEVYNNQPYGTSADIYSLGLVLYWMLNERRMPFLPLPPEKITVGMDEQARQRRMCGVPLPPPAHGSDTLKQIVLKACAFDPQDRYSSACEMGRAIAHLVGEQGGISVSNQNMEEQEEYNKPAHEDDSDDKTVESLFCATVLDASGDETTGPVFKKPTSNRKTSTYSFGGNSKQYTGFTTQVDPPMGEETESTSGQIEKNRNGIAALTLRGKEKIAAISASETHAVSLRQDFTVRAMGDNLHGKCEVADWENIMAVSCGDTFTIGLHRNGNVQIAGKMIAKEFEDQVKQWNNIIAIAASPLLAAGLTSKSTVQVAGASLDTQDEVSLWKKITDIAVGNSHVVGLRADGTVCAAGNSAYKQCGVGAWINIKSIAAGGYHTIACKRNGRVIATGNNSFGQCETDSWRDIISVKAGQNFSLGLSRDGTVAVAGGTTEFRTVISEWNNIEVIQAGKFCAIGYKADGSFQVASLNEKCRNMMRELVT